MKFISVLCMMVFIALPAIGQKKVTISGIVKDENQLTPVEYATVTLKNTNDSAFVSGTISNSEGRFILEKVVEGSYLLEISFVGLKTSVTRILVGKLSDFLDMGIIVLGQEATNLSEVEIRAEREVVAPSLEKKTISIAENLTQSGGSLLQVMQNLPGITVSNEGTVKLRGNDRVTILIDGRQTALTGFGNQRGLDNIPASAIDRIEIINNPSAKYEANGNAGIINIILKKEIKEGLNGKVGLTLGMGALWEKNANLPTIRPQYKRTPKVNPSVALNYRRKKTNLFLQADNLYTQTLNKNEFVDRFYDADDTIRQQTKRNRTTNLFLMKTGLEWFKNDKNTLTVSGLFSSEKILDRGDEPFFNGNLSERLRLWKFLEDEIKTTIATTIQWEKKFKEPGRKLTSGINYTFHREDEQYFFENILPTYTGLDSFKLISDENVLDYALDYIKPYAHGRIETGLKLRYRFIPTNMKFIPGLNSPLDVNAGGWATYNEIIPAIYGNYIYENELVEVEAGMRIEYVDIYYEVNPDHNTYKSDGYNYIQPFPAVRFTYKFNPNNTFSISYNRRVDRPNEVDIRIFPKYDDAEIIKVGNPGLRPQFTQTLEGGFRKSYSGGYIYLAGYYKDARQTITRIGSIVNGSTLIYNIFQNAGQSKLLGSEVLVAIEPTKTFSFNINLNIYKNVIDKFSVLNKYPVENSFTAARQELLSGNVKLTGLVRLKSLSFQVTGVYQAPDLVPQGKIFDYYTLDIGIKKTSKTGRSEWTLNGSDLGNTMRIRKSVTGTGFRYISTDYYETQVIRLGYMLKF